MQMVTTTCYMSHVFSLSNGLFLLSFLFSLSCHHDYLFFPSPLIKSYLSLSHLLIFLPGLILSSHHLHPVEASSSSVCLYSFFFSSPLSLTIHLLSSFVFSFLAPPCTIFMFFFFLPTFFQSHDVSSSSTSLSSHLFLPSCTLLIILTSLPCSLYLTSLPLSCPLLLSSLGCLTASINTH